MQLIRLELARGEKQNLTAQLDLSLQDWQTDPSGQIVYFAAADRAKTALYSLPAATSATPGKVQQIFRQGDSQDLIVAGGQRLYFIHHSLNQLPEL